MFSRIQRQLIARGYWDEAGGAGDVGSGGAPADQKPSDDGDKGGKPAGDDKGGEGSDDKPKDEDKKPSESEAKLLKEVMQKKDQIKDLKSQLDQANAKLSEISDLDIDAVRKMLSDQKAAEQKRLEEKGEFDKVKAQIVEQHQKELDTVKAELETFKSQLSEANSVIERLTVGHAFDSSGFIAEELLLTPAKARVIYGDHFDVVDGKVIAYDSPRGASNRAQLVDGKGEPLPFDEAIRKIVDTDPDRDRLIRAKAKPGAGSATNNSPVPDKKPELRGQDRIAAALNKASN